MKPTLYLTNWSSLRTPGFRGNGRVWTIMAKPRTWEHGDGRVEVLIPSKEMLEAVQQGRLGPELYRLDYQTRILLRSGEGVAPLAPGRLAGRLRAVKVPIILLGIDSSSTVKDGDTLCCSCSREKAARGNCHRVYAAELLKEAGWRVVLDGKELT